MINVTSAIRNTVSITAFNRGLAGKIFSEVKESGAKVVIKNNIPEAVIMSPDEYVKLIDAINDAKLILLAKERMENFNLEDTISLEDLMKKYGTDEKDLEGYEELEI